MFTEPPPESHRARSRLATRHSSLVTRHSPPVTSSLFTLSRRRRTGAPEADMSRRSRAARRRIALGMKIALSQPNLSSLKLFRFLCSLRVTSNPLPFTISAF